MYVHFFGLQCIVHSHSLTSVTQWSFLIKLGIHSVAFDGEDSLVDLPWACLPPCDRNPSTAT